MEPAVPRATAATPTVIAEPDPRLRVHCSTSWPAWDRAGADPAEDRPAHVRAGSGVAWLGDRLAIVQDDAAFVALVSLHDGKADALALPRGPGGARQFDEQRGNKADKLDLEACVVHDGVLYAFGSGSTPARERVVRVRGADGTTDPRGLTVDVIDARALYATLRVTTAFAGSELNVEGAALLGVPDLAESTAARSPAPAARPVLRLFQRGNGAPRGELVPVNATCDLAWDAVRAYLDDPTGVPSPAPTNVVRYDLGAIGGARLTFTDATPHPTRDGAVLYLAVAEASPDTYHDGEVMGCAVGVIEPQPDGPPRARYAVRTDHRGEPLREKPEGIVVSPAVQGRVILVVDHDDPARPSRIELVSLSGDW